MLVRIGDANTMRAGEMHVLDVAGTKVTVANADGQLYVIDDTCTHMGCSLGSGDLDGTTVTCPCHGSQFDVRTGAVLRGPAQRPVRAHQVQIQDGSILAEA